MYDLIYLMVLIDQVINVDVVVHNINGLRAVFPLAVFINAWYVQRHW